MQEKAAKSRRSLHKMHKHLQISAIQILPLLVVQNLCRGGRPSHICRDCLMIMKERKETSADKYLIINQ